MGRGGGGDLALATEGSCLCHAKDNGTRRGRWQERFGSYARGERAAPGVASKGPWKQQPKKVLWLVDRRGSRVTGMGRGRGRTHGKGGGGCPLPVPRCTLPGHGGGKVSMRELGGWWRLWMVVSVVLGGLVFVATFRPHPTKLEWVETVPANAKVDYERWRAERLAGRRCQEDFVFPLRLRPTGQSGGPDTLNMWCTPTRDYLTPSLLALIPGALLLVAGLTFAWVRAGFRRAKA
jgi:hypothetical protein